MDTAEPGADFSNEQFGATIQEKFYTFLEEFAPRDEGISMSQASAGSNGEAQTKHTYVEQLKTMRESEKTTLYVDWEHLNSADCELADTLRDQYLRVDAFLRKVGDPPDETPGPLVDRVQIAQALCRSTCSRSTDTSDRYIRPPPSFHHDRCPIWLPAGMATGSRHHKLAARTSCF